MMRVYLRLCLLTLTVLVIPISQANEVARAVTVVGEVDIKRPARLATELPTLAKLHLNDAVSTKQTGSAKLLLENNSVVKLAENTQLLLDTLFIRGDVQHTVLKQDLGHVRIVVGQPLKPRSSFEVHTPSAIVGVRGTTFDTWVGGDGETVIRCLQGRVEVRGVTGGFIEPVVVRAGYYTVVAKDGEPSTPVSVEQHLSMAALLADLGKSAGLLADRDFAVLETVERQLIDQSVAISARMVTDMRLHAEELEKGYMSGLSDGSTARMVTEQMNYREISGGLERVMSEPLVLPEHGKIDVPIAIGFPSL